MKRLSLIFCLVLLAATHAFSQIKYPVISQTIITPPYPMSLEDFYANGGNKLTLQLLVKDVTLSNYPVKFRLVLSGRGVTIATSPSFVPEPFMLNGGEAYSLSGADLAAYFNPNNLDFSGYSKAQYQRTGRLPDGVYQLSFEVIYYNRNISVASTTPALIWLSQNEPPLLNFPSKNQEISALTPQNIMFNWTLMHSPFSTPTFAPDYKFDLWEVWPDDKNPEDILRTTEPIYTTTVKNTSLMYTVNEPFLLIGRRYVWRVRVLDPEGNARFTNDGYSEARWFRFGKVCPVPVIAMDKVGVSSFSVKWDGDYRQSRYEVRYREKKRKDAQWYTKSTTQLSATIDNLKSVTDYEVQVCGFCEDQPSDYSDMLTASTKAETKFECGVAPVKPDSVKSKPLDKLNPRDFIKAGDFDVLVTEASGSNGSFSGKGQVLVPYLKFLRVEVTFKNIKVNEDYQLTDGAIYTVYNLNKSMVLRTGNPSFLIPNPKKPVEDNGFTSITTAKTTTDTTVTNIVFNNGGATITYANGKTETIRAAEGQVIAITDEKNKDQEQYVADPKTKTLYSGKPETLGSNANTPNATPQPKSGGTLYNVTFVRHNQESYGFDAPAENAPAGSYESVAIDGKPTLVPWKSIEAGNVDRVKAKVTGGPTDSIHYRRESEQLVMTAKGNADTTQVLLNGMGDMEEDYLYAWYPEYTKVNDSVKTQNRVLAGQLNMVSYQKQKLTVYLVPVNGCVYPQNLKDVQNYLNRIYGQALVEWDVKEVKGFEVSINSSKAKKIDNTVSNENMDYSADMKVVNEAFTSNSLYNKDAYYLFFFDDATNQNIAGYMPFNQQFGYIFKYNQQLDVYLRTIAHELGHGPFRLYHTFSSKNKYVQTQGSTINLMDYVDKSKAQTAIKLQKYQWDEIHSWHLGANWLESGDEAESITEPQLKCISDASNLGKLFVDPDGKTIRLSTNQFPFAFFGQNEGSLHGRLAAYKENGKIYIYFLENPIEVYSGYYGDINIVGTNDASKLVRFIPVSGQEGILVKISNEGKVDNSQLKSCQCGFSINFTNKKSEKYNPGGKPSDSAKGEIIDYTAGAVPSEEMDKLKSLVGNLGDKSNIKTVLYLTSAATSEIGKNIIKQRFAKPGSNELVICAEYDSNTKKWTIKDLTSGDGDLKSKKGQNLSPLLKALAKIIPNLDSYEAFNPLTAILDGITGLIDMAIIPERFYNPDVKTKDYNPIPAKIYAIVSLSVIKDGVVTLLSDNPDNVKYSPSRCDFAFVCGVWNGLIGTVSGISSGTSMVIKLITNEDNTRTKLGEAISKLNWDQIKKMGGDIWSKYTANPCMVSYGTGEVAFVVISAAFGGAEAKGAATFFKVLDQMDVIGQMLNQAFKISGKILKPVLNYSGKSIKLVLEKGVNLYKTKQIVISLQKNTLYCGIPALEIKIVDKIKNLTEVELEKLQKEITEQVSKVDVPFDENGNKLVEVTIGGETTPVIVGTEEGLNKVEKAAVESLDKLLESCPKLISLVNDLAPAAKNRFKEFFEGSSEDVIKVMENANDIDLGKFVNHITSSSDEGIKGLSDIMKVSKENAQLVVNSWKKADELGCFLKKKGFPGNSKRPDVYSAAKTYQGKISGNPDLSFEKNGISFDAIENGKLIDAKFGYGKSTFEDVLDEEMEVWVPEVINDNMQKAIRASAQRQINAIAGTDLVIEWFVSNDLAKRGISQLMEQWKFNIKVTYLKP